MNDASSRHPFRSSQLENADGPGLNPTASRTMGEIIAARFSRRGFLRGSLAATAISATVSPLALLTADPAHAAQDTAVRRSCRRCLFGRAQMG